MKTMHLAPGLDLPANAVTQKFAVLAESGAGKTYTGGKLAELMLSIGAQVIILEPVGVWWGLQAAADGKHAGFSIAVFGGDHANVPLTPESGELVGKLLAEKGVSAVLDLSHFTTAETKRFVRDFAEAFFQAKKKHKSPVHLFFEEAQTFAPQMPERDEGVMLNRVERLLKVGRNYGVGWTLISQQPQAVHKRVLNLAGTVVALRTTGLHERKAISEWAKSKLSRKEDIDLVDHLPGLDTGQAHVWSPSFLKIAKTVKIAKKTTFDSSATPELDEEVTEPKVLAKGDIEHLREAMKTVVAEVEAKDPTALQQKVRKLEAELAKAKHAATQTKTEIKRVEIPMLKDSQTKQLERAAEKAASAAAALDAAAKSITAAIAHARGGAVPVAPAVPQRPPLMVTGQTILPRVIEHVRRESRPAPPGSLPKGERAVLSAIAQHAEGVTREQITVLTGYKRSTRDSYLQRLREKALIDDGGERIFATDSGRSVLGPDFKPLPTGAALLEHWRGRLPAGELAVLNVLVAAYPAAVEREKIDEATGYQRSSRDSYLQRLGARRLVTEPRRGQVRASDMLFDGAAAA